ncbi:Ig-like domain-containing protein [Clostridiaceae bacterium HSG29]|nr:Ig-like domain-containing protein [Clostridiaceae bacterium HSG29]
MKRILSLVLVIVLVLGSMPLAFADETVTAGETLKAYGLLDGVNEAGDLNEEGQVTRAQMIKLLETLLGEEAAAAEFALPATFTDVPADAWYAPYVAYAELMGYTNGMGDGTFAPDALVSKQMVATYLLRALGYEGTWATAEADALALGIDVAPVVGAEMTRGEAFTMMLAALDVPTKDTEVKLGAKLEIEDFTAPEVPVVTAVAVESAVALNSTMVEVALDEDLDAPASVDASVFTVVDEADTVFVVESATFAGWDTDNYTVLVTLSEDLTAGTLYTLTSGDTTANFGGKDADEDEPTVVGVTSEDYNQVAVEFNEAIDMATVKVELNEKYGDQDELVILDMEYDGNDTILLTTADQAEATLYEAVISEATDLAGNEMDEDDTNTFVGTEKPDADQTVTSAETEDYNKVVVNFSLKVAPADVLAANFEIFEKYGDENEIVVLDAVLIDDADDTDVTSDSDDMAVLLTVEALSEATLYELTVENVGSIYGTDLDTDTNTDTFVGMEMPDADLTATVASTGNTEVEVTFSENVDADSVTVASFVIAEKYGDEDALVVTAIDVDDAVVTLTTEDQAEATLYEITITDAMDIYGNGMDDNEVVDTFVGNDIGDAIDSVDVARLTDTTIAVIFDVNVGDAAADVSFYNIDNGIGFPEKAVLADSDDQDDYAGITDYNKTVILTIPETEVGTVYELTVAEGIENSDGIVSEDELTDTFAGQGEAAGLPELEAAMVVNDQMLKLYFNKDVDDEDLIDTTLLTFTLKAIDETTLTAYQDPTNDDVLVLVGPVDTFKPTTTVDTANVAVTGCDSDNDDVDFALLDTDVDDTAVKVSGIMAINSKTLRIYFDQYVSAVDVNELALAPESSTSTAAATVTTAVTDSVDDEQTIWDIAVTTGELTDETWTATITAGFAINNDIVFSTDADDLAFEFAGSDDDSLYIDDVYAVMIDEKHINVIYPEAMDTSIDTVGHYTLTTGDTVTLVDWNDEGTIATLVIDDVYASSVDEDVLTITAGVITDAAGVKLVQDEDDAALEIDFGVSTSDADEVVIDELTATSGGAILVIFDQNVTGTVTDETDYTVNVNGTDLDNDGSDYVVTSYTDVDGNIGVQFAMTVALETTDVVEVTLNETTNVTGVYDGEYLEEDNSATTVVE